MSKQSVHLRTGGWGHFCLNTGTLVCWIGMMTLALTGCLSNPAAPEPKQLAAPQPPPQSARQHSGPYPANEPGPAYEPTTSSPDNSVRR